MELSQSVTYSYASTTENLRSKEDDEEALKWAALERLPTRNRVRKGILHGVTGELKEIDIRGLSVKERKKLVDRLVRNADNNEEFLFKLKERIDRVGIELPTIEVRFKNLKVEAEAYVGRSASPTVVNFFVNLVLDAASFLHVISSRKRRIPVLHDVSGIIRPGRLTLLLGLPGSGKTTLLRGLSGKLPSQLKKSSGDVTYNGHAMCEFVPERTSAYISEHDVHMPLLTVRETLAFSAKCQGVGSNYDMLMELLRREKLQNIKPDPYIDALMKASVLKGKEDIVTDYILKILGIEGCADTIIGNDMIRGISGGQKRRVTAGEVLVGPVSALFMDNISTGLDSSTTFQIVNSIRQSNHIFGKTTLISLLQPPPETYELFDDVILLSEGQIIYQGPCEYVLEFFEWMGFRCPESKGVADFLQEVTSRKDQRQYWDKEERHYRYVSSSEFAEAFTSFHVGRAVEQELCRPFEKSKNHPAALMKREYGASKKDLLKACLSREVKLLRRSLVLQITKVFQVMFCGAVLATVYLQTRNKRDTLEDGIVHLGPLFFLVYMITFTGFFVLPSTIDKLPVFYKQRDLHFYPSWAFSLPLTIISIPIAIVEVCSLMAITYYALGFEPNPNRIVTHFLVLLLYGQAFHGFFRCMATITRDHTTANTVGNFCQLWLFLFSGYLVSRENMKNFLRWGFYTSPQMYALSTIFTNEFLGSSWAHTLEGTNQTAGIASLKSHGFSSDPSWQWIGLLGLIGFILLYNVVATFALAYLNPQVKSRATILSEEVLNEEKGNFMSNKIRGHSIQDRVRRGRQKLLPFIPLSVTFENIKYSVDMPKGMKNQTDDRLVLLKGISGCFRPGVLTAMMGVSGAGKTTLMDVLAGRKNTGYIEGKITVSGHPKNQASFARVSGYCEQTDVHTPFLTVYESLVYSAWLRLPQDVDSRTREVFIEEVMDLIELTPIRDDLVGVAAVNGLTVEQRKRLTIAVELVANPSVVFMDEPTSGLDARAAAVVMRTIRKTVDTGRAIVCTIHQPSVEIFESFDELYLLNRGGEEVYVGPLGPRSREMVKHFENIPGVGKIGENDNPATWVMEITSKAREEILGVNFSEIYKASKLHRKNMELIQEQNKTSSKQVDHFSSQYSQPFFTQLRACLWKQNKSYWRNVPYNATRFLVTTLISLMFGLLSWNLGSKRESMEEVLSGVGAMFSSIVSMGPYCVSSVQPVIINERAVYYRERSAGMYSAFPYAIAQAMIEIPYTLVQALIYGTIIHGMMGYEWTAAKYFLNILFLFMYILCYINYGIMVISVSPSREMAGLITGITYTLWSLFSGFIIQPPRIVRWWRWYMWLCPSYWILYGLTASQYGDVNSRMVSGEGIKDYLRDCFGFRHEMLWEVSLVLIGFAFFFFIVFAVSMKVLNFQKR